VWRRRVLAGLGGEPMRRGAGFVSFPWIRGRHWSIHGAQFSGVLGDSDISLQVEAPYIRCTKSVS